MNSKAEGGVGSITPQVLSVIDAALMWLGAGSLASTVHSSFLSVGLTGTGTFL